MNPVPGTRSGTFTLVELLVVILIISVLAGLLLPSLQKALQSAKLTACAANLRSIGVASSQYASDFYDFVLPYANVHGSTTNIANNLPFFYWGTTTRPAGTALLGSAGLGLLYYGPWDLTASGTPTTATVATGVYVGDANAFYCPSTTIDRKIAGMQSPAWDNQRISYSYRNPERGLSPLFNRARKFSVAVKNNLALAYDNVGVSHRFAFGSAHETRGNAIFYDGHLATYEMFPECYADGTLVDIAGRDYNYPQGDNFVRLLEANY